MPKTYRRMLLASLGAICALTSGCDRPDAAAEPRDGDRAKHPEFIEIPAARLSELTLAGTDEPTPPTWLRSGGGDANARYSPAAQIDTGNVHRLAVAWTYRSRDGAGNVQANPAIADGVIYAPTAGKHIVAIDGATGRERWRYAPYGDAARMGYGPATRGLTFVPARAGTDARLYFMADGYLVAIDARSGRPVEQFGENGRAASIKGAGTSSFLGATAPVVLGDIVVAANQNFLQGFDAETGRRRWAFDTLTYPVENPEADNGGNIWGGIALDGKRGIVFAAVGDPHPNFIGIDRRGDNRHSNSVIAVDARTGRLRWAFQAIRHDIWDLDISAPPNLVTITREGRRIDAVAQVTKQGVTLLLDRMSGKPIFPYRMRRAPASTLAGEVTALYQPAPELPQPFTRQTFTRGDLTDIDPAAARDALAVFRQASHGFFVPHEVDKPTLFYGVHGGAEWPGAAFDPATGWLFVTANQIAHKITLRKIAPVAARYDPARIAAGAALFRANCAACHGAARQGQGTAPPLTGLAGRMQADALRAIILSGRGGMPPFALPRHELDAIEAYLLGDTASGPPRQSDSVQSANGYTFDGFTKFLDAKGYPATKPPWGTLTAIDLNSGRIAWQVPLGEHPELTRRGIRKTGTENFGGATVTAGGLVFAAGTRDRMIRAFDKRTGRELWRHALPFGGFAPPAVYMAGGRQYVVVAAAGGGKLGGEKGDAYVAFALPRPGGA